MINQPPYLIPGKDLANFEISESTAINSVVYTLEGADPEGKKVFYTISGDNFSVDRDSGKIRLRESLDRESIDMLDVVITIQDENDQHIIPFRRTIKGYKVWQRSKLATTCLYNIDLKLDPVCLFKLILHFLLHKNVLFATTQT